MSPSIWPSSNDPASPARAGFVAAYRRVLAQLIHAYLPLVSPSTYWSTPTTNTAMRWTSTARLQTRVAGLDEPHQIAHPSRSRSASVTPRPRLGFASIFGSIGGNCRAARPLVHAVRDTHCCGRFDDALAGGVGMYNGQKQMLSQVVDHLAPGRGLLNRWADRVVRTGSLGRLHANDLVAAASFGRLRLPGVRRIAFVATKADKVHADDHDKLWACSMT